MGFIDGEFGGGVVKRYDEFYVYYGIGYIFVGGDFKLSVGCSINFYIFIFKYVNYVKRWGGCVLKKINVVF